MIRANSAVIINRARIRQLTQAQITALEQTAEALHTDVVQAQVMPFDKGALQNEQFFVEHSHSRVGQETLVHSTPYARRLYYHPEYDFQICENPRARGEWYEDWLKGGKKENFCKDIFKKLYREAGDL